MIFLPAAVPLLVLLLVVFLVVLVVLVELRVLSYAYQKIGIRPRYVFLIMLLTLLGSGVNIPLYQIPAGRMLAPHTKWLYGVPYAVPEAMHAGVTVVAVNVGGALIPTLLSLYLFLRLPLRGRMVIGTAVVKDIQVIKNNRFVFSRRPKLQEAELTFTDTDAQPGQSYYYVRVAQADDQMAWSSPIWVSSK